MAAAGSAGAAVVWAKLGMANEASRAVATAAPVRVWRKRVISVSFSIEVDEVAARSCPAWASGSG